MVANPLEHIASLLLDQQRLESLALVRTIPGESVAPFSRQKFLGWKTSTRQQELMKRQQEVFFAWMYRSSER
jgi:hypothetical protein